MSDKAKSTATIKEAATARLQEPGKLPFNHPPKKMLISRPIAGRKIIHG